MMAGATLLAPRPLRLADALAVAPARLRRAGRRPREASPPAMAHIPVRRIARLRATGRKLFARHHMLDPRAREIGAGERRHPLAELLAQGARPHLLDRALRQLAELERPERQPDQPVHRRPRWPSTFLTSRFLPSRIAKVSQTLLPWARSTAASIAP